MDTRPAEQPEGTYPYGKNGIQYDLTGSLFNEPGFRKMMAIAPYQINGVIETDTKPILFSTNNTDSAIGFFNPETELYEPVYDDRTWTLSGKLGFSTTRYIRGQAQRNYKGELVIAFTDKATLPKYANMDRPDLVKSIDDFRLFATFSRPTLDINMGSGGILPGGTYYIAIGYEKNDGTSTPYSPVSKGATLTPGQVGGTADKTLEITISNADQNYDSIRLAIISKVSGVTKAIELTDYLPVSSGTIEFTYTGEQLSTDISVSQILTPPAQYDRVGTIGQLNDYAYLGVLHSEPDLDDMQPYALQVKLEWASELKNAAAPDSDLLLGKKRGFMHGEVYAFYIRYKKKRGGMTKWFITAGVAPRPQDLVNSTEVADLVPRFKLDDCIPYFDPIARTGGCGGWINSTETYPDTIEFDATLQGGPNLRGQAVRHYRMPSLLFTKKNLYATDDNFGRTDLDLLGIKAFSVKIPDKYIGIIDGYEIGYAIRTVGNRTIQGQAPLLYGATSPNQAGKASDQTPTYTTGGNFTTNIWHSSQDHNNELQTIRPDTFRMHPFDLLFFKPAIAPSYIAGLWKLRRDGLSANDAYIENTTLTGTPSGTYDNAPAGFIIDYTTGAKPLANTSGMLFEKIKKSFYTSNNLNVEEFINNKAETAYSGYIDGPGWPVAFSNIGLDTTANTLRNVLQFEETYMANLVAIKSNLYENFYSQQLASAGEPLALSDNTTLWGGDTFVCAYTFHTYGRYNSIDAYGGLTQGVKIARRIVCESTSNIALRFDVPGNQYSLAWPKAPLIKDENTNYLTLFDRSQDPNQFGYTKDYNAINDLIDSNTWNPFREYIYDFPYRIHRGGKASRQGRPRAWRTFLPLDYYEIQKNMGLLINVEGMDDKLIIHTENAMFLTQDKARLESGVMSITLGSGDIFQFEPQEAISSKLGYAGTQHDLACVRTPFGYVFVDAKQGEMYIYKGKLSMLNSGINTFLRDALKVVENNPYIGNGITIGWDQKYKRILLTVKNKQLTSGIPPKLFKDTDEFWSNLQIGDTVLYHGRLVEYLGTNNTTYDCPPDPVIHVTSWEPTDSYCLKGFETNHVLAVTNPDDVIALNSLQGKTKQIMSWLNLDSTVFTVDLEGRLTYTGTTPMQSTISWHLAGDRFSLDNGQFKVQVRKQTLPLLEQVIQTFNQHVAWSWSGSVDTLINPGDVLDLYFEYIDGTEMLITLIAEAPTFSVMSIDGVQATANAGFKAYKNRRRLIDGILDGYSELNDSGGLGPYFPPVQDLVACPITPPTPTWYGADGICLKAIDSPSCDVGYTYDSETQTCRKVESQAATPPIGGSGSQGIVTPIQDHQWNNGGARIFLPNTPVNGSGTVDATLITPHLWVNGNFQFDAVGRNTVDGRMNAAGIWVLGGTGPGEYTPLNEYIGFARKFESPIAQVLYVAMCADNDFKFTLNGVVIVDTASAFGNILGAPNFSFMNIYPLALAAGTNYIEMYAKNAGSVAGFAAEIYGNTRQQLIDATTVADLNILFSTRDMIGEPFDLGVTVGYNCPAGWSLDTTDGVYTCVRTDVLPPIFVPGNTNSGIIHYNVRCRKINGIPDGFCENNTSDGSGQGPFIPDILSDVCTQTPLPTGDTFTVSGTIKLVCNDQGCSQQGSTQVELSFDGPTPTRMSLLFGAVYLANGITPVAVGYQIMPGAIVPGGSVASPYYLAPEVPFTVDIPAGTTILIIPGGIPQVGLPTDWLCNNCQKPVTDLYVKIDPTSIEDTNIYQADFTLLTAGVTLHNVV